MEVTNDRREMSEEFQVIENSILQVSFDGILLIDTSGNIIEANDNYSFMSGYSIDELLRMNICHIEATNEITRHIQTIEIRSKNSFESKHKRKDGTIFDVEQKLQYRKIAENDCFIVCIRDVSEHKKYEDEILKLKLQAQESEKRYLSIFNSTGTANAIFSPDGILQMQNQMSVDYLGNSMTGKSVLEIFGEKIGPTVFKRIKTVVTNGESVTHETVFHLSTGEKWFRTIYQPILSDDGKVDSVQIISHDVTEIKKSHQEILKAKEIGAKNEALNLALFKLLKFSETHTIEEVLEEAINESEKLTGSMIGFYHFVDEENQAITLQNWSSRTKNNFCKSHDINDFYPFVDADIWIDCIYQRQPLIFNNYQTISLKKGIPEGYDPIESLVVVPVIFEGKIKAILGVGNLPTEYTFEDIEIIQSLADLTWETIERKMAEERADKLLKAVESSDTSIVITDKSGNIEYANPFFTILTGYEKEEYLGANPRFLKSNLQPAEFYQELWDTIRNGKTWEGEFCNKKKNGELYWENAIISPICNDKGEITNYVAVKNDITERKNSESKLHKWSNIFKNAKWGITISSPDNDLFDIYNPAFAEMHGYNGDELIGKHVHTVFAPEVWPDVPVNIRLAHEKGHHIWESVHIRKDGTRFPVLIDVTVVKDLNGNLLYRVVNVQDISDRKYYENELIKAKEQAEQSEKLYRLLAENSDDVIWLIDLDFNIIYLSPSVEKLFGYSVEECKVMKLSNLLKSKTIDQLKAIIGDSMVNFNPDENRVIELEGIHKNGKTLYIEISAKFVTDEKGAIKGIQGISRDVSERREYLDQLILAKEVAEEKEKELKHSHDLMQYIIEHNRSAVAVHDRDLKYIYVSQRYLQDYKVKEKDIIGRHHYDIFPDLPQKWRDVHKLALQGIVSCEEDDPYYKDDGTVEWTRWECRPWYEMDGTIGGIIVYTEVITPRKNMELQLIAAKDIAEENETKHRDLLDTMFEAVTLNELIFNEKGKIVDYRILETNNAFNNHSKLKREEVVGRLATEIYKMDPEFINEFWKENLHNVKSVTSDYFVEEFGLWSRINTSPVKNNKFTTVFYDITDQKKSEEIIKQKTSEVELHNARLESLLRISQYQTNSIQELLDFALEEAIRLTESKIGYIYYYQEESKQFILNSWSREVMKECMVMNPQSVYDLNKTGCWGEVVRQKKPIVINDYEQSSMKKGTPHGHVQLHKFLSIPVIIDEKIVAVAGVANKLTDYDNSDVRQLSLLLDSVWKISERVLLVRDLKAAKEKAEESDRLKTAFIQNLSHEIRTPMNAIIGFSELMATNFSNREKLEKYATVINKRSNDLLNIIDDLLDVARIESGQISTYIETFGIESVFIELKETFELVYVEKIQKSINFRITIPDGLSQMKIRTDKQRFKQIFTNLINNAFKFTESGTIEFGFKQGPDNSIIYYVSDTGIGIQESKLDLIFTRFVQLHDEQRQAYGGNGLGLSIVKGLLELLNGKIWVESAPDIGSTFYFTLKDQSIT